MLRSENVGPLLGFEHPTHYRGIRISPFSPFPTMARLRQEKVSDLVLSKSRVKESPG